MRINIFKYFILTYFSLLVSCNCNTRENNNDETTSHNDDAVEKKIDSTSLDIVGIRKIPFLNNPTTFVFNKSKEELRKAILNNTHGYHYENFSISFYGDTVQDPITGNIFKTPANKGDFFLDHNDAGGEMKSHVYFKGGEPVEYGAFFHLHIDSVDSRHTRISVITINPIITYDYGVPTPPHDTRPLGCVVPPSTIEEYEILHRIGELVGEKNMPAIKYPKE